MRLVSSALMMAMAACSGNAAEQATVPTPTQETRAVEASTAPGNALGEQVFATRCASCHGPEGRGDGPVASTLDPKPVDLYGPRPERLRGRPGGRRAIIENGSEGSGMVAFKDILTPEELEAVYLLVHNMRHGPGMGGGPGGGGMGGGPGMGGQGAGGTPCGESGECPP